MQLFTQQQKIQSKDPFYREPKNNSGSNYHSRPVAQNSMLANLGKPKPLPTFQGYIPRVSISGQKKTIIQSVPYPPRPSPPPPPPAYTNSQLYFEDWEDSSGLSNPNQHENSQTINNSRNSPNYRGDYNNPSQNYGNNRNGQPQNYGSRGNQNERINYDNKSGNQYPKKQFDNRYDSQRTNQYDRNSRENDGHRNQWNNNNQNQYRYQNQNQDRNRNQNQNNSFNNQNRYQSQSNSFNNQNRSQSQNRNQNHNNSFNNNQRKDNTRRPNISDDSYRHQNQYNDRNNNSRQNQSYNRPNQKAPRSNVPNKQAPAHRQIKQIKIPHGVPHNSMIYNDSENANYTKFDDINLKGYSGRKLVEPKLKANSNALFSFPSLKKDDQQNKQDRQIYGWTEATGISYPDLQIQAEKLAAKIIKELCIS